MILPEHHVRLVGSYGSADLDRLVSDLAPLDAIVDATVVQVDLELLNRIAAPALAVLVATVLEVAARGVLADGSRLLAPRDAGVRDRLHELDVYDVLAGRPLSKDFGLSPRRGSRPCQRFTGADEPGSVAQSLTNAMAEVCETDEPARNAMWFALNEIAQNVADHSNAHGGAVAIADVTRGGAELEVAIADHGIGIRASLESNPAQVIASDLEALRTAVSPGVSARPDRPGPVGLGLYLTQLLLRDNGGTLVVRSGTAQLEGGATSLDAFDLAPLQGTLVTLRFRTDKPVSLDSLLGAPER